MHYQNQQRKKVLNQVPGPTKICPNSAGLVYLDDLPILNKCLVRY